MLYKRVATYAGADKPMKTNAALLAVHKTFEPDADGKKSVIWYVNDGNTTSRLNPKKLEAFLEELQPGTTMRFTAVNALDVQLTELQEHRGITIVYAHWHDLGLAKGLSADDIVAAYFKADASLFRTFVPRKDIAELRKLVAVRNAIIGFAGDAIRRIKQAERNHADPDSDNPGILEAIELVKQLQASRKTANSKGREVSYDTRIDEMAATIRECVLFNQIVGFKSYGTAAAIVSASGGFERFPRVSSVWHYFGQHNIDGKAAKRKKGQAMTWSPNGRTALYLMMESIIKNKKNPWNAKVHQIQDAELAIHAEKHPNCPTPKGHTLAMAKRKVQKEILKRFFIALKGEDFVEGQISSENQRETAFEATA